MPGFHDKSHELYQTLRSDGLSASSIADVARSMHLPVATAHGVLSAYTEFGVDPAALRICRGTSCMLAGADDLAAAAGGQHRCRGVYCIGYCDRSPAVLMPDGQVETGRRRGDTAARLHAGGSADSGEAARPSPLDVRCVARSTIATARLRGAGCADLQAARAAGVYTTLESALLDTPERIIEAVERSGLRGRGGAGFPTGRKWRVCAQADGDRRYIIANGDEGDPGSFIDRDLMERDPHSILEAMILAAHAIRTHEGIVYIRSEYPHAAHVMRRAIEQARAAGFLGESILGGPLAFDVRVVSGLGSYVCGEETALLNAIEGKRGEARPRPPFPAERGLYGQPTVVDNVETLINVPWIVRHGAAAYRALGTAASPGTKAICLNHGFARPGIVEVEFGTPLRRIIEEFAGGPAPGRELDAILLGGPMGSILRPRGWDVSVCIDAMSERGIRLGHGGIVALPSGTDYAALLRHLLEFMADESCGKCTPCRIGTKLALERVAADGLTPESAAALEQIFQLMEQTSLCGFGRETPGPVRQLFEFVDPPAEKGVDR